MRKTAILEAAPYVVFGVLCALTLHHTVDDAYISFRYAKNLAAGHGLVYNVGERVEGYSNPLWVYVLALSSVVGFDPVVVAKALGFGAGLATLWLLSRLLERRFSVTPAFRYTALLFLAGHVSFVFYAVAGLETVFFACLIVLLHWGLLESRYLLAATAAGLAAVCRPEGILLVAPLLLGLALSPDRRRALPCLIVPLAILCAQFAFRHGYYGKWWPNTFYAKASPAYDWMTFVIKHTAVFADGSTGWAFAHLAYGVLGVFGMLGLVAFWRVHPPMVVSICVLFFFVWYSKRDWMAFDRFHVPILPLFLIYGFAAISGIARRWAIVRRAVVIGVVAVFLVGFSWSATARELRQLQDGEAFDPAMSGARYMEAARYIRARALPDDLVAAVEVGVVGYVTGLRVFDELGLVEEKVPPLLGPMENWDRLTPDRLRPYAEYVFSHEPRFLIINFEAGYSDHLDAVMRSLHDRMIAAGTYVPGQRFRLSSQRELAVFVLKDDRDRAAQARCR